MFKLEKINLNSLNEIDSGIKVFKNLFFKDQRGLLSVNYEGEILNKSNYISIKESYSNPMTGRGLHFQKKPFGQDKIISLGSGSILDFVYNTESKYREIYYFPIDSSMNISIYLPSKFAHGFIALEETIFRYLCIGKYNEQNEITYNLLPNISRLLKLGEIFLSKKDSSFPDLDISF